MTESIPDWIARQARERPDARAAVSGDGSLTYTELAVRVSRTASALAQRGVAPGERVAVLAGSSLDFVVAMHATVALGAVFVPMNTRLTGAEIAPQLRNAQPVLLLADADRMPLATEAAAMGECRPPHPFPLESGAGGARLVDRHEPRALHSIVYTSGTTGEPKGVMLTHANFAASAHASAANLGVERDDCWLSCLPLHHVGGLSIPIRSAIYGTAFELHPGFDAAAVNAAVRSGRVTLLSVVATMLARMLDADGEPFAGRLRAVLVGGGPVPPELLDRATARGLPVVQTYGLTEAASQVTTLAPPEARAHLGSAGRPLPGTEVRIEEGASGAPGEILVRGDTVAAGYFRNPEATAAAFRDGWLHTGDAGQLDADGYLTVLDRADDLIVTGGENVYPSEVEAALLAHPAITGAAVVGAPDPEWGRRIVAAITTSGSVDDTELDAWLRARLAGYKLPREIVRLDEIPATASGKVRRAAVRELLGGGRPR